MLASKIESENSVSNVRFIKFAVLILLCFQNAGHALLTRYSTGILKENYSASEVVLFSELIKLVFSAYVAVTDRTESDAAGSGLSKLLWLTINSKKVVILVILYSVANVLSYYALARVDASVYTVMLQLKIFSTAAFAVLLLGRNISSTKWRALILLVIGCILVASPTFNSSVCDEFEEANGDEKISSVQSFLGVASVLVMVVISGYSAIYFEKMLKSGEGTSITIWERNFQLALYSTVLLVGIIAWETNTAANASSQPWTFQLFRGWTLNTVLISLLQASGGLLVAATLKYADAVLKTLATSGSIVLSAVLGWMLLGGSLDIFVSLGACATILAIFNYTLDTTVEK